ncbi:MAG: caspase family protein, partial [Cyanothece sp. SIO2G6]|nr:caspase family protein [Cyanothece sp. SIO2G6]
MGLSLLARRYQQVLATPTSRKLALLIGIDSYSENVFGASLQRGASLDGAVTDVELVKELLLARFGFNPSDILILQDKQATRDAILSALQGHFLDQVDHDDVVVLHCSGLGSCVRLNPSALAALPGWVEGELQPSFVPIDG